MAYSYSQENLSHLNLFLLKKDIKLTMRLIFNMSWFTSQCLNHFLIYIYLYITLNDLHISNKLPTWNVYKNINGYNTKSLQQRKFKSIFKAIIKSLKLLKAEIILSLESVCFVWIGKEKEHKWIKQIEKKCSSSQKPSDKKQERRIAK